ncbi:hypothetical protein AQUCO_02500291v1 [Aquilegia coerulea]|uniref:DUF4283 domain-containing protein n=1 Tax=Aquilegia coerulea TaxID=218851 RepID=A0A2G5DAC3_AQUCA|nr:hypothetical protein AQUCO_02500291v1 [Aquilegia coerulea]
MADLWSIGGGRNSFPQRASSVLNKVNQNSIENPANKISYADKVRRQEQPVIEYSELLEPGFRGEYPTKKAYDRGLEYCKFSLIARLEMQKLSIEELKTQASRVWALSANFNITPLGKGFLHLHFENYQKVWTKGPWRFGTELMRLQKWEKNFRPENQKRTNALVWIRLPNLSIECWDVEALLSIGRAVGYPMKVDETSISKQFGYYANVLVDVDLNKPIPEQVLVETEDYEFWQDIVVTKLPKFCNHCKVVGHLVTDCRKLKSAMKGKEAVVDSTPKEQFEKLGKNTQKNKNKKEKEGITWVEKHNSIAQPATKVVNDNKFQALVVDDNEEVEGEEVDVENDDDASNMQLIVVNTETTLMEVQPAACEEQIDPKTEDLVNEVYTEAANVEVEPLILARMSRSWAHGKGNKSPKATETTELINEIAEVAIQLTTGKGAVLIGDSPSSHKGALKGVEVSSARKKKIVPANTPLTRLKAGGKQQPPPKTCC